MKKKLLVFAFSLILGVESVFAARGDLFFKTDWYTNVNWNSNTKELKWPGDFNGNLSWTFIEVNLGKSGLVNRNLLQFSEIHITLNNFNNASTAELAIQDQDGNGSPGSGDYKRITLNPGENIIDLSAVDWGDCDPERIQDITIYGGVRTNGEEQGSVIIAEAYLVKPDVFVHSTDYSTLENYNYWGQVPAGGSRTLKDGALEVVNPNAVDNWNCQYIVDDAITTISDEDYRISITLKSSAAGDITCVFGNWTGTSKSLSFSVDAGDEWVTKDVLFSMFPLGADDVHVMLQHGALEGTIQIKKVEVFRVPEICPIAKPNRTATDAKTDVFASFETLEEGATWDPESREFTKTCGWKWTDGIDLSQYRYIVITAGQNMNTRDVSGEPWDFGAVTIKDNNNFSISGDDYGDPFMNMYFSQYNNHSCCKIDLEKLRKDQSFNIYDIRELTIKGGNGFLLGNVYATNQVPNNTKNYGDDDNGDFKIEDLTVDKFGTICLPWQAAIADAFAYSIVGKTGSAITLSRVDGLLEAGKAYFYKTNINKNNSNTYAVRFYKATASTVASPVDNNGLIGRFTAIEAPVGPNYYILSNNTLYDTVGAEGANAITVGANKAYIDVNQINTTSAKGRIELFFNGADETTGIENLDAIETLTSGKVYDLSGRVVTAPTKGLYIVNGKKVFVK